MALNNGWIRIDTTSGSGNTAIAAVVLERNTGRTESRSATLVGTNAHGATATATIKQDPIGPILVIDHVETLKGGDVVSSLAVGGDAYYIVGYANSDYIEAIESGDNTYTDLNDAQGLAWNDGFTLVDGETTYTGVELEDPIHLQAQFQDVTPVIGTTRQYLFKIPFSILENETGSTIEVTFFIGDGDGIALTFSINQDPN